LQVDPYVLFQQAGTPTVVDRSELTTRYNGEIRLVVGARDVGREHRDPISKLFRQVHVDLFSSICRRRERLKSRKVPDIERDGATVTIASRPGVHAGAEEAIGHQKEADLHDRGPPSVYQISQTERCRRLLQAIAEAWFETLV